jgi:hypothetical protein
MKFFRVLSVLSLAAAMAGCRDTLASALRVYELVAVNGHPLPVTTNGIDDSFTLLAGKLYLADANAIVEERNRYSSAMSEPAGVESLSRQYFDLRIRNDTIAIGQFGCTVSCNPNLVGLYREEGFTLAPDTPEASGQAYTYRLIGRF